MAKKPTTPKSPEPDASSAAPKLVAKPKAAKKTAPKPKTAKSPASPGIKAAPVTQPGSAAASITSADIALRAYYIAEKRHKLGIPGDSTSDWVEAERQLKAEAEEKL